MCPGGAAGAPLRLSHFFGDGTCQNIAVGGHLVPMFIIGSSLRPDMGVCMVWAWPICGPPWFAFFFAFALLVSIGCYRFFRHKKLIQIFRRNF